MCKHGAVYFLVNVLANPRLQLIDVLIKKVLGRCSVVGLGNWFGIFGTSWVGEGSQIFLLTN